ncbi:hypothetical protein ACJIZ3_025834 [Penstemon smallii]|uniref:NAC domain-containing protein n=1 Tax=Penstemon smallii TaxID=265156 RepID=A0ABD3TY76_9LAMI
MSVQCFPPGYHFNPTDDELVVHYLKKKIMNEPIPYDKILEVNIYEYNPQQLSEKFPPVEENVWYFFTPRDRKFQNCARVNRVAGTGNWKATAKDKPVRYNGEIVGSKKVLVFYEDGKSKTNWIMYEYTIKKHNPKRNNTNNNMRMDDWVLCRIYNRDDKLLRNKHREVPSKNPCVPLQIEFNPQSMDFDQFNNNNNYIEQPSPPQSINYMSQSNGQVNITNDQDQDQEDDDEAEDNIVIANYDPSGFEDFCMDLEIMLSASNNDIPIVEEEEVAADDDIDIMEEEVSLVDNLHLNVDFDDFCKRFDNSAADDVVLKDFCIDFVNNLN